MTGRDLREIAAKMMNLDLHVLEDAGVIERGIGGMPKVGGSDWRRFNDDPLVFICKLPDDRLEKLAELVAP